MRSQNERRKQRFSHRTDHQTRSVETPRVKMGQDGSRWVKMGQDGSRWVKMGQAMLSKSDESPELGSSHKMKMAAFNKKSDQEIWHISDACIDYNKSKD